MTKPGRSPPNYWKGSTMRVWRKISRIAWTTLLGVALLAMTDGHGGVAVGLYRLAVVAGCFWIFAKTVK